MQDFCYISDVWKKSIKKKNRIRTISTEESRYRWREIESIHVPSTWLTAVAVTLRAKTYANVRLGVAVYARPWRYTYTRDTIIIYITATAVWTRYNAIVVYGPVDIELLSSEVNLARRTSFRIPRKCDKFVCIKRNTNFNNVDERVRVLIVNTIDFIIIL